MGVQLFKISIEGGHKHFASSVETLDIKIDEQPPDDMKLQRLTFLVTDAENHLVYREIWPESKISGAERGKSKANKSEGPPEKFTWDGWNNQLPDVVDDKGGKHHSYVTPLQSPFKLKVLAHLV